MVIDENKRRRERKELAPPLRAREDFRPCQKKSLEEEFYDSLPV